MHALAYTDRIEIFLRRQVRIEKDFCELCESYLCCGAKLSLVVEVVVGIEHGTIKQLQGAVGCVAATQLQKTVGSYGPGRRRPNQDDWWW